MVAYYCIHIYTSLMQYNQISIDVLLGQNLRAFLSVVMLLMGLSALKQLRMFKNISNLIVTLQSNLVDISSFMIVLAIAICSYSAILLFLWMKPRDFAADQEVPDDQNITNLSTVFNAVITVVYMATGSFETGLFDNTLQKILAVIFVIIFVICIFIVMMNALIAILGDSYERVQNSRVSTE